MPTPWIGWHVAPLGHVGPAAWNGDAGLQISAHWDGSDAPAGSSTHSPCAVAPTCVSAGHGDAGEHLGEQNDPGRP
jgi:hypothetical protein